jgi:pimeloyl-ACP methyl ester carboxylesterase
LSAFKTGRAARWASRCKATSRAWTQPSRSTGLDSGTLQASDVAEVFTSEPDRLALGAEYAQWLVEYIRSAYASGIAGARDDWLSFAGDWGFDLADIRNVTLWQGDRDDNVVPANATWLAEQIPNSTLKTMRGEGHMSIGLHFPEILRDLLGRATRSTGQHKQHHG